MYKMALSPQRAWKAEFGDALAAHHAGCRKDVHSTVWESLALRH